MTPLPAFLFAAWLLLSAPWTPAPQPGAVNAMTVDQASFYGGSYISMPLQDARSTTELRLRFRTKRPDALLFLAAGKTDYCLVRLESGRLKVHVNLGAGESEMQSAKGLRLDDMVWHEVYITRRDAEMTVQVDSIHVTKETLPGRFYELNVHFGLFVGGQGDFSELFLGHLDNLRGCMADVSYNGVNVLARARERIGAVDVHGVTWSCAEEFDVGHEREVSFVEEGAFIALPNAISRTGASWQFEIKTGSKRGVLLYNTGLSTRSDFVGVELEDGKVRLLVDKGDKPVVLPSEVSVADGRWHRVTVLFNPTLLEVSVDGKVATRRVNAGSNKYLDLAEIVYVGGVELNKRARALGQGLKSVEESFKGCIRNMEVDGKKIGIPEARVTLGILPDCVWDFPCARDDPCVPGARCFQHGVDSFRCECELPLCVKPDYVAGYKIFTKTTLPVDLEIVALNTLAVSEGTATLLTPHNLDVVLDYPKFGVRDSGVIFRMVTPPKHGRLQVEQPWQRSGASETVFTLLDMGKDKVKYVHDGTENHLDSMELDMELSPGAGYTLPGYLQGRHRFVLPVNITPVNDPPELTIPAGKVLRLAQGTVKVISSDLLQVIDPDTPASELVYSVLSVSVGGRSGQSRVQLNRNPAKNVTTFTQKDVEEGVVAFNHSGDAGAGRIALQVSDGIEAGTPALLRVVAFALQLRLVNNTGLVMTHNSSTLIIPRNLAFVTNADEPESIEIRFEVTKAAQFGELQRLRGAGGEWQPVQHFTSFQLAREQIRYAHTSGLPTHDEFKFQVSAGDTKSPTTYDFRIIFVELRIDSVRNEEITLDGVQDGAIRPTHLHYDTVPQSSPADEIVFHVGRAARYGFLILSDSAGNEQRLAAADTFSQLDINNGKLRYALKRRAYSRIHDDFTFRVATKSVNNGEPSTDPATFSLLHIPGPTSDPLIVTLERLEVIEGGQQVLSQSHLNLVMERIAVVNFNITRGPRHGRIDVLKNGSAVVGRPNATFFSSKEVAAERVLYVHDDSESRKDSFHFLAWAPDFQYLGIFHFDIILKNDNKPTRTIDRVFRVVKGGERMLTGADLRYEDADIDTKPEDIVYTRRGIPNGGIFSAENPSKGVFEFTQADLDAGKILFRHDGGDEYGKVVLHVSDGDSYASGVLEVRASSPFVEVVNNSGLVVQRGAAAPLTLANLSVETNVNARASELRFEVLEPPSHGQIQLDGERTRFFSQHDVEQGGVSYLHDAGKALKDHFRFRVEAGEQAQTDGRFDLRIFPAAYWEPLEVIVNHTLHVEESTSVQLGPEILKVVHPQIAASDVTFVVQEAPHFGYLEVEPVGTTASSHSEEAAASAASGVASGPELTIFDQAMVDSGRLHYVQAAANATRDRVVVDVTNGIWSRRGLWLRIVVVPKHVYVRGGELSVAEGAAAALTTAHVAVLTEYYADRVTEFKVTKPPKAGKLFLQKEGGKNNPTNKFTTKQLEAGLVTYQHNGSEALTDQFSIVARVSAGERDSLPATVRVTVLPVDDEQPRLVNNTGLTLYEGAVMVIKPDQLGAEDVDSPAENVTFVVSAPRGGFLSLRQAPRNTIERFTQAQLQARQVLFVHNGDVKNSGFHVSLTDGVNAKSEQHWVNVTVRELTLTLAKNARLHVFPLLRQVIGPRHLLALTTDPGPPLRLITFTVRQAPKLGRLITETAEGKPKEVVAFSQRELNESKIWYEHTKAFTDLAANDSFIFDVSTEFAEHIVNQLFKIDISVSSMTSDGLDRFLKVEPIVVDEGGASSIRINTSGVARFLQSHSGAWTSPPTVLVMLTGPPANGEVLVQGGQVAEAGAFFTQQQLDTRHVIYQHDHSDTESDEILFSLVLQPKDEQQDEILLYNGSVPVTIRAVNDQQFHLRTNSPNMSVVQGQRRVLTSTDLLTEDPDTPAPWIIYDIINEPKKGRLLLVHKEERNGTISELVKKAGKFTQEDINRGHVVYEHSGPLQPTSFYFRVSDGHFNPIYTVFNIHVLPLELGVRSLHAVPIQQGASVAFITSDCVDAETNGDRVNVRYNVTRAPHHGKIYLRETLTESFGQGDVDSRQVMYMQTDMTTSMDSFVVAAWLPGTDVQSEGKQINVTVEPLLVRMRNLSAIAGAKNRLGIEILDAGPLAKLTNSNPVYEVARKPKYGRIKKIIRVTNQNGVISKEKERDVGRFTHEEVKSGVIYYVSRRSVEVGGVEDGVTLVLAASIFQPAVVELSFKVRAERHDAAAAGSNPNASVSPPRRGGTSLNSKDQATNIVSPNINPDYVLLIGVVFGIISAAVLIVALVKCRGRRRRMRRSDGHPGANGKEQAFNGAAELLDAAPTLPRPPDNLLPLSPRPNRSKRFANGSVHYGDAGTDTWRAVSPIPVAVPVPVPAIPQCKVIPLDATDALVATTILGPDVPGSDAEINSRYPYGVADEPSNNEDWSSFDTQSELPYPRGGNPMLRRNQYWV